MRSSRVDPIKYSYHASLPLPESGGSRVTDRGDQRTRRIHRTFCEGFELCFCHHQWGRDAGEKRSIHTSTEAPNHDQGTTGRSNNVGEFL